MSRLVCILLLFCFFTAQSQSIPSGQVIGPFQWKSRIYPGTQRNYWLYIPQQYDKTKPACLMVVQDGWNRARSWNLPALMDTLIAKKEAPVQIGIFIEPGIVPSADTSKYPHFNRSFEYDALGDRYARFLLEEIIPAVKKSYNLSDDPNDRLLAGSSSGAICAFNAAWERPNAFRRVFSSIGTYVGLRGGHELATLVRKTEPKPLRIFLQDGSNDNNSYGGDWWMANQNMLSALKWAGYEVNHAWGDGGHDQRHTVIILADALRWLWKDYPIAVTTHANSANKYIYPIIEGEDWKEIKLNMPIGKLAVNKKGELFFTAGNSIFVLRDDHSSRLRVFGFRLPEGLIADIAFDSTGQLYISDILKSKIISIDSKGIKREIIKDAFAPVMTISEKGIYFADIPPTNMNSGFTSRLGFFNFNKNTISYLPVAGEITGMSISVEKTFLNIGIANSQFGYYSKIKPDGSLEHLQQYIHYHIPYDMVSADIKEMAIDTANVVYTCTNMGVQVSDQLGRVNLIFSKPEENPIDLKFGGPEGNILYVNYNGKLFFRRLKTKGTQSWDLPVRPSRPRM